MLLALLLAGSARCRAGIDEPLGGEPLFGQAQAFEVLTESPSLDRPPSRSGNRFLSGWWPEERDDASWMVARSGVGRLELVTLVPRERRLEVRTNAGDARASTLTVRFGDRVIDEIALATRTAIDLPGDLPVGRSAIDLSAESGTLRLGSARLSDAQPRGEAVLEGKDLLQTGFSAVEIVRPVGPGSELVGTFQPPPEPGASQRFDLQVESPEGESRSELVWRPRALRSRSHTVSLRVSLGATAGLVRIRLLALGQGAPGRWQNLRLLSTTGEAVSRPLPSSRGSDAPTPSADMAASAPRLVVVYVMDALRANAVGHLAGSEATPTLDRLAQEGASFTNHFSIAPNTLPSTKSLFTGLTFLTRGGWQLPGDGPPTLAERFSGAGYRTALFTGNGYLTAHYGLTRGFERATEDLLYGPGESALRGTSGQGSSYNDNAERIHEALLRWLDELGRDDRAFAFVQTIHPHNPYAPPEPYRSRFTAGIESSIDGSTDTLLSIKHHRRTTTAADRERLRGLYHAALAYNDAQLQRLLEALLARYPAEEILLVVTSDHGEELFDHGGVLHGYTLYDEQLRIPLILWWPSHISPARIETLTDTLDLHATLASLTDSTRPVSGRPLWPLLRARPLPERQVLFAAASSLDGMYMARSRRYKTVWAPRSANAWGMGQGAGRSRDVEYVFDLLHDPLEQTNLAGEDILEAAWLRSLLFTWVEVAGSHELGEQAVEVEDDALENLRALGYVDD